MTLVVFVMHEAKKNNDKKKYICLIFKIFLVTSAQHLFLVFTEVSIRIYNEYVRQILQLEQIFYFDIFFAKFLRNLIALVQYCNAICGMEFSKNGKKIVQIKCFCKFLKSCQHFLKKRCVVTSLNWDFFFQNLACKYFYARFWIIASIMLFHSFFHVFQQTYFNLR